MIYSGIRINKTLRNVLLLLSVSVSFARSQDDPLQEANRLVKKATGEMLSFTFEERTRWEERDGVNFGGLVNQQDMLSRLRVGSAFQPWSWLKVYAMGQDARIPFYGAPAPATVRDTMDLQEAYIEFSGERKTGLGATFGREMLDYGESRVIGTPQWTNVARTYDGGRIYFRKPHVQIEALLISPVKVLPDSFNRPDLGDRIWGTYNTFSQVWLNASFDAYALRHSQNRIGGWSGAGTLGTSSFGGRFYGPLPHGFKYSLEGIGQTGHLGPLRQRAYAWFTGILKPTTVASRLLILSLEYKLASGTKANTTDSGTYDQLSPANHDKFGHEDLFGWRNLKTLKSLETWKITKTFALNLMYSDERLYSASDALYNSQGSSIARSKKGTAGTHVGQELDSFVTYQYGAHLFGAGFGHFFKGEFIENTTAHVNPRYFYIFQQYTIK